MAHDAVVIGAGHNGLVAANVLADAGWSVLVHEAEDEPGGSARSGELIEPGFVHDFFSAFFPLGAASPVFRALGLEIPWRHGPLVLAHSDRLEEVSHGAAVGSVRARSLHELREVAPELPTLDDALGYFADEAPAVGLHVDLKLTMRLDELCAEVADRGTTVVMCSEAVWWRCHRRLVADAALLLRGVDVAHLAHDGRTTPHEPSEGARVVDGLLHYDVPAGE